MSSAHDAHGAPAQASHDHDHFDGEPATELSPGEPRTPSWMPALGLAFFTVAAVWLLVSSSDGTTGGVTPPPALKPAAPELPAAAAPAPMPRPVDPGAAPTGSAPGMRKLTPAQVEDLKKRIEEARQRGVIPGGDRPAQPGHDGHQH